MEATRKYALFLVAGLVPLCSLGVFAIVEPSYFRERGFPLDDAWIHAVYARELARSATLAYNPGIAVAGETSPLWALLTAGLYLLAPSVDSFVLAVKAFGFALHVATTVLICVALRRSGESRLTSLATSALVGAHPDLVAASVSGMEVPLATAIMAATAALLTSSRVWIFSVLGALAFLGRPEMVMLPVVLPAAFGIADAPERRGAHWRRALFGLAGGAAAALAMAARNYVVTGRPLPSTFYAKAQHVGLNAPVVVFNGFRAVVAGARIPVIDNRLLLILFVVMAVWILLKRWRADRGTLGSLLFLSGMLFIAVTLALVPPVDPNAFYHQRYFLPGLVLVVAGLLPLVGEAVRLTSTAARYAPVVVGTIAAVLLVSEAFYTPGRYSRLENDAHNIDDVQVRIGRYLERAPDGAVYWAIDAGASRFFGRAFVVDMMGLNTPQMLTDDAQTYLDQHPPTYLDFFPGWSRADKESVASMTSVWFETSTPYSVTDTESMRHHLLLQSTGGSRPGTFQVRARTFTFTTAPDVPPATGP